MAFNIFKMAIDPRHRIVITSFVLSCCFTLPKGQLGPELHLAGVTALGTAGAATTSSFGADTSASVSSTLASTGGTTPAPFGVNFDALASMDDASNLCNFDALETAVFFECCGAMVLFD